MRDKILTAVSVLMLFLPWTILPLRIHFQWALDYAHIMIPCYAGFMIFSGVFTTVSYAAAKVRNPVMKVCLTVNGLYAVAGAVFLGMIIQSQFGVA
ncbi:MAG: hypothetical protein NC432_07865 [Roseburia sp.]|nr:hypothetical protein [Roseburia sp.]MCM1097851.1 hypothetical protein [Ruminococcus flavefaciens]